MNNEKTHQEIMNQIETAEKEATSIPRMRKPNTEGNLGSKRSPEGVCTLVNSKDYGKRWMLSKETMSRLDNPETVGVAFTDTGMAVGNKHLENSSEFTVKKIGNKGVIYSSSLVEEITKTFDLDFDNRSSITFTEAEEHTDEECGTIIIIIMKTTVEDNLIIE